jgi:rRNA maturation RNase YbeY
MKTEITNLQKPIKLSVSKMSGLARFFCGLAAKLMPACTLGEISVVITDDEGISRVNRRHLGRDGITDVISFLYPPMPGENGRHGAEIFVNAETAVEIGARRPAWGPSSELALYLAHGCDHLTGADDQSRADRARMRRRELGWVAKAKAKGLVSGLVGGASRRAGSNRRAEKSK